MQRSVLVAIVFSALFLQEGQSTDALNLIIIKDECGGCSDYLISGPRGILDDKLTASSIFRNSRHRHDAKYSRLNLYKNENYAAGGWSAGTKNDQQYIQAEFPKLKYVKSILTQGRADKDQWVKSYSVSYSIDGLIWSTVKDINENTIIYPANSDRSTIVTNTLPNCLEAKYIRLHPKTWHLHITLRFDVIGCSKLDTRFKMSYKRHPIILNPAAQLTQVFETTTNNLHVCAVKCHQNPLCVSFVLKQPYDICNGFQEQIYQGGMASVSVPEDNVYFISLSHLENYEYEIVESLNLCYKIFTLKANADAASIKCKKEGAKFLSVRNLDQINAVQNDIKNNWILSQESRYYVDGSYSNGLWKYATGKDIPAILWSPSHPLSDNGGCVTLTSNGLETHTCIDNLYFICGM